MTHTGDIGTNCECQYTLTLTNQIIREEYSEMRDNFNHAPSKHEVSEDETNPLSQDDADREAELQKDIAEDESTYAEESFFSDETCNESDISDAMPRSMVDSCTPPEATDCSFAGSTSRIRDGEERLQGPMVENASVRSSRYGKSTASDNERKSLATKQVRCSRKNMSFTDEEMRKIERENRLLLMKIMARQKPREKTLWDDAPHSRASSSAINRKKLQRKIEYDNMLLLQRLQQTKSCITNTTVKKPGCRLTFL